MVKEIIENGVGVVLIIVLVGSFIHNARKPYEDSQDAVRERKRKEKNG